MALPQILAATVTIAFEGLMLFQGDAGGRKHVAIVNDPDHSIHQVEVWRKVPQTVDQMEPKETFDLKKGDTVGFGVDPGAITTDRRLLANHVPRLKDFVLKGDVHDDVIHQTFNDNILAFVTLPAGRLTTWSTFTERVALTKSNTDPRIICFARFVVLKPTVSIDKLVISHNARPYPLNDGDLIIVSNASDYKGREHPHFPGYGRLLSSGGQIGAVTILKAHCKSQSDGINQFGPAVENVLKGKKQRSPNGDCGPASNPPKGG